MALNGNLLGFFSALKHSKFFRVLLVVRSRFASKEIIQISKKLPSKHDIILIIISINSFLPLFHPAVFLCILCLTPALLPAALSCPAPCLCYSDGVVDCGGRGLSSLPPLHLLPPGSHSLMLANNKLASLGASAFSNFSTLEVRLQMSAKFLLSRTRRSVVAVCTAVPH